MVTIQPCVCGPYINFYDEKVTQYVHGDLNLLMFG